jgi:long-subunit acyl-CoA synthetase (AMP-forming)
MASPPVWETLHATIAAAIADASPLGRLGYRLALDASPGSFLVKALVLNRVKTLIGLRRARTLLCNSGPVPPALLRWYRALGLNIIDAGDGEGWRPRGASDTLMDKESR